MIDNKKLGELIRRERENQEMSRETLAAAAGCSARAIAYWEAGKKSIRVDVADKIFKILKTTVVLGEES